MQIAVYFILPETKGVSLERMNAIFGGIDHVAAAEEEEETQKREAGLVSQALEKVKTNESHVKDERVENVEKA